MQSPGADNITDVDGNANDSSPIGLLLALVARDPHTVSVVSLKNSSHIAHTSVDFVGQVVAISTALLSMGINGCNIAVLGYNSYNWLVAFMAIICSGNTALPIDFKLSREEIARQLKTANAKLIFCDSKLYSLLPSTDGAFAPQVVMIDDVTSYAVPLNMKILSERGMDLKAKGDDAFKNQKQVSPLYVTFDSGLCGRDKAVVVSCKGLVARIANLRDSICYAQRVYAGDFFYNTRSLEAAVIAPLLMGRCVCICEDDISDYYAANLLKADTVFTDPQGVRGFYEGVWIAAKYNHIMGKLEKKMKSGVAVSKLGIPVRSSIKKFLTDNGVYSPRNIVCFGDNIDSETVYGIYMLGTELYCAYSVPECGIISVSDRIKGKKANIGAPLSGISVKIDISGRISVKSDAIMSGYYGEGSYPNNQVDTGDRGEILSNGTIVLLNDPRSVYIARNGKRVFPEKLKAQIAEGLQHFESFDIVVENDDIILKAVIGQEFLKVSGKQEAVSLLNAYVEKFNKKLCDYEQITEVIIEDIE